MWSCQSIFYLVVLIFKVYLRNLFPPELRGYSFTYPFVCLMVLSSMPRPFLQLRPPMVCGTNWSPALYFPYGKSIFTNLTSWINGPSLTATFIKYQIYLILNGLFGSLYPCLVPSFHWNLPEAHPSGMTPSNLRQSSSTALWLFLCFPAILHLALPPPFCLSQALSILQSLAQIWPSPQSLPWLHQLTGNSALRLWDKMHCQSIDNQL